MKVNIVRTAAFERKGQHFARLDSEFVVSDLLDVEVHLQAKGGKQIRELVGDYPGPILTDSFASEDAPLPYIDIDAVDTDDGMIYPEPLRFGDRPSRAKYIAAFRDILVSNVRPNRGAVALISKRTTGAMASSGFSLLRMSSTESAQEYVYAFLRTLYGRTQLIRRNRGSMYPAVVKDDVFDVWVPSAPRLEQTIATQVREALTLQDQFFDDLVFCPKSDVNEHVVRLS